MEWIRIFIFIIFYTTNVNGMIGVVNECNKLKEIKGLHKFITNKVNTMRIMFQECNEIEYLDLSNFNTSNVTDMRLMFNECIKLKAIKGLSKINSNKVENMKKIKMKYVINII